MARETEAAWRDVASAWMTGEVGALDDHLAPDVRYHMPPVGDFDRDGIAAFIGGFRKAFPDFVVTLDDTVVEGDRVVWLWHCSATFSGESPVVPVPPDRAAQRGERHDRRPLRRRPGHGDLAPRGLAQLATGAPGLTRADGPAA